ncbi:MAG: 3D domain-containing protein [Patescibacteria group bacterium]
MLIYKYPLERGFFIKNNMILIKKSRLIASIIIGIILLGLIAPKTAKAEPLLGNLLEKVSFLNPIIDKNTICRLDKSDYEVKKKVRMIVTAYSSRVEETDDTPFITASGKTVADGIIANNMLPFGSKIRIPELYGDKIFIVEDRMHQRKGKYHVDIWFPEYEQAKEFGAKLTYIEILKN